MGNPTHLQATGAELSVCVFILTLQMWIDLAMRVTSLCFPQETTTRHPSSFAFSFPFLKGSAI